MGQERRAGEVLTDARGRHLWGIRLCGGATCVIYGQVI